MKIDKAEETLGLTDTQYDNAGIALAYAMAMRRARTRQERTECRTARTTLERYLRSMEKSGMVGTFDRMRAAMNTIEAAESVVSHKPCKAGGDGDVQERPSAGRLIKSLIEGASTGTGGAKPDTTDGTARHYESYTTCDTTQTYDSWQDANGQGQERNGRGDTVAYRAWRASVRPSTNPHDSTRPLAKAVMMTLWDMTPWRFYLVFWGLLVGILCDIGQFALGPNFVFATVRLVCVVTVLYGIVDVIKVGTWRRAMTASARRIDAM